MIWLKTKGLQIEKKDNNVGYDCEIYLLQNHNFPVKLGQWADAHRISLDIFRRIETVYPLH
jgi:hypothetical protein